MKRTTRACLVIAAPAICCIATAVFAEPNPPRTLDNIFAPVVVGTPPVNAFNGLFRCPDGEIRHYGDDGFLFSRDNGLTWKHRQFGEVDGSGKTAGGGRPLGMNPKTGTCLRMVGGKEGMFVHRSTDGPDGQYAVQKVDDRRLIMVRPPYFLKSRDRMLFAAHGEFPYRITIFRSDDDGLTWAKTTLPPGPAFQVEPPHQGPRWENWCVEPTILELLDGRLWMLARTSRDNHHECFSDDAGKTWSAWQPSRFYGTLTMPTLYRLSDGRVLILWCNTTPLPEIDRTEERIPETAKNGRWEDVFTNRDVCHAAISEDDGRTWIGFREMRLNPLRNAGDFGGRASHDFSVHQPQALELPTQCLETNARSTAPKSRKTQPSLTPHKFQPSSQPLSVKILVAHGQDEEVRALVIFDTEWLYEPRRRSTFENDLADWSTHKYIKGIVGHCAYNRVPGPRLIPHPDKTEAKVLQIRHPIDSNLVFDKDGAVWNFPAAVKGSFVTRIKLLPGGGGARICLVDRWFNPTDPVVQDYSIYALNIPGDGRIGDGVTVVPGRWHELRFDWSDSQSSICKLTIDGAPTPLTLPLVRPSVNGISYVHFQASSDEEDLQGFLIESVGGGRDNLVENNLMIECDAAVHLDARGTSRIKLDAAPGDSWNLLAKAERLDYENAPWSTRYPKLASIMDNEPLLPLGNVIRRNVAYRCKRWLNASGMDKYLDRVEFNDNLENVEDPGFVDAAKQDFRLREDSAVLKLPGWERIPIERIGLYEDEYRAD